MKNFGITQSVQINNQNQQENAHFQQSMNQHIRQKTFQHQLKQIQTKLFQYIIQPQQIIQSTQNDFNKKTIYKLSQSLKENLQQNLEQIKSLTDKLSIPTLNNLQKQEIKQKILQLTMKQLANTKVLVQTYVHSEYRLVLAYFHIARIYQELNCHQQAEIHLANALDINAKYLNIKQAMYVDSILLTFLASSLFERQKIEMSLQHLNKALLIHQQLLADQFQVNDFITLVLISKVLSASDKNQQAISYGKMAIISAQKHFLKNSFESAKAYKNLAQVQAKSQFYPDAIQAINIGIQTLEVFCPQKQDTIIQFYTKLSQISLSNFNSKQNKSQKQIQSYISILKKRYQVIQNIFGYRDKRSIKQKRHLAAMYIKCSKIKQAEQQLQDLLEIQSLVYGEKSVQVGKTFKMLGNLMISQNQLKKAEVYFKKSQCIFHDQGYTNLQKEVSSKLFTLTGDSMPKFNKV